MRALLNSVKTSARVYACMQKEHHDTLVSSGSGLPLRFAVGTRVLASFDGRMHPGIITQKRYTEPGWPPSKVAAYQILMDNNKHWVIAMYDTDWLVTRNSQVQNKACATIVVV